MKKAKQLAAVLCLIAFFIIPKVRAYDDEPETTTPPVNNPGASTLGGNQDDGQGTTHQGNRQDDGQGTTHQGNRQDDGQVTTHQSTQQDDRQATTHQSTRQDDGQATTHQSTRQDDGQATTHQSTRQDDGQATTHQAQVTEFHGTQQDNYSSQASSGTTQVAPSSTSEHKPLTQPSKSPLYNSSQDRTTDTSTLPTTSATESFGLREKKILPTAVATSSTQATPGISKKVVESSLDKTKPNSGIYITTAFICGGCACGALFYYFCRRRKQVVGDVEHAKFPCKQTSALTPGQRNLAFKSDDETAKGDAPTGIQEKENRGVTSNEGGQHVSKKYELGQKEKQGVEDTRL